MDATEARATTSPAEPTRRVGRAASRARSPESARSEPVRALGRVSTSLSGPPVVPPDLRIAELLGALRRRIARRPVTSTLIAMSAGFVLGGALSFRAGRMALTVLGRHAVRELLKEIL